MTIIHRNARPFFLEGNKEVCCLLIHGFTGSPADMGMLGSYLHEKGFAVSGILLPGHGTTPEEMKKTNWEDWYSAVEKEYRRIRSKYKDVKIVPMGLSMGGLLALHLARHHQVEGVAAFSTPVFLADPRINEATELKTEYIPKDKSPADHERDQREGRFSYDVFPFRPLLSMLELIGIVKSELKDVQVPALCIQSQDDSTVRPDSARYLYDHMGSITKKLVWLEKSGHVLTLGEERFLVFREVEEFIDQNVLTKGGDIIDI